MEAERKQEEIELVDQNDNEEENQNNNQNSENNQQAEETQQTEEQQPQIQEEIIPESPETTTQTQNQNQNQPNIPQTTEEKRVHYGDEQLTQPINENNAENNEEEAPKGNIIWRGVKFVGYGLYKIAYSAGEFLADLFGITRPRYEFALNEYYDRERARILRERMERGEVDENGNEIEQPNTA